MVVVDRTAAKSMAPATTFLLVVTVWLIVLTDKMKSTAHAMVTFINSRFCTLPECIGSHKDVYMCGSGSRCLRREDVCSPYSNCPNATFADKAFCAIQHLRTPHDD